jgi:hypothetical protein
MGFPNVVNSLAAANARWTGLNFAGDYLDSCGSNKQNKGCAYAMFNLFKGLKLQGITTLASSTRGAGPGPIPAGDWYAEYVDWLLDNQTSPTTTTGGGWIGGAGEDGVANNVYLNFSCCYNDNSVGAAMAELILSPVALIAPDPGKFATVGLSQLTSTNVVGSPHTVTATAESTNGAPVPGATVNFEVISGPNAGASGSDVTDANGKAEFTYVGSGGPGVDEIQGFIGNLESNILEKTWVEVLRCDADSDGDIDTNDLKLIRAANRQPASSSVDPRDGNGDGKINVADQRFCTLRCTLPKCAVQ